MLNSGIGRQCRPVADDWIQRRFQEHQQKVSADKRRQELQENARASYDAFFHRLKQRVERDVAAYNSLWQEEDCKASFAAAADSFTVMRNKNLRLHVKKNAGTTVINIERSVINVFPIFDTIEIAPDEQGNICYKHGNAFLCEVSEASEAVLSDFLCE